MLVKSQVIEPIPGRQRGRHKVGEGRKVLGRKRNRIGEVTWDILFLAYLIEQFWIECPDKRKISIFSMVI